MREDFFSRYCLERFQFFIPYRVLKQVRSTIVHKKNEPCRTRSLCWFAEREGFEPPEPLSSTVFKTAAIDHSAISPFANVLVMHIAHKIYLNNATLHRMTNSGCKGTTKN